MESDSKQRAERRIGFFPITGDPIHYGHLRGALAVQQACDLQAVYIQVCGDLENHKPGKASKYHRHAMAKLAIAEFEPRLRYTPLGYDRPEIGEELFLEFIELPEHRSVERFFYIAGVDNLELVRYRFLQNRERIKRPYELVFLTRPGVGASASSGRLIECPTPFSSSEFRDGREPECVPAVVRGYCRSHKLYCYGNAGEISSPGAEPPSAKEVRWPRVT